MEAMEASKVYAPQSLDASFESSDDNRDINLTDLIGKEERTSYFCENLGGRQKF